MSLRAAPHDLADRPFVGTPRVPPFVMLCHVSASKCGRYWVANTVEQYNVYLSERDAHHVFCSVADKTNLILPS